MDTSKRAIALQYFPDAKPTTAEKRLMIWINRCSPLVRLLEANGYRKFRKNFTRKEVDIIFDYLGEP